MPPGIALFDVLGTVLDERRGFRAAVASVDAPAGSPVADGVASGELSWRPWDQVIGDALTDLDPGADDRGYGAELRSVGHRLPPWPDSRVGVEAISGACRVVALSKGGIGPFVDCSRAGGLVWDAVLSSEMVRSAEPDLQVYRFAPDVLGVDPADVVMVAAHPSDLRADDAFYWTARDLVDLARALTR